MKLKVIGLLAVYSALGLFGICLRAGESNPQPPPRPPDHTPVAPSLNTASFANFGKGGVTSGQFNGSKLGGFARQTDLFGKKVVGIEDGPTQVLASTDAVPVPPVKDAFVNPKVEPGKVKWHADFDTACKAAAKSGKPVLLFQMMGKLDDQFC